MWMSCDDFDFEIIPNWAKNLREVAALFSVELKLQKEKVADVAKAKNNKLTSLVQAQQMAPNKRHIFALISNRFMFPA